MATLKFGQAKGKAQSNKVDTYTYKDGDNVVRMVGGILPRYIYWVKGTNDKDIPVECLHFDRELEKFNRLEEDHVQKYFPDAKCAWAYAIKCIDPADGKVKVLNLKKKLFESIMTASEDLGDPTDPDTGWDVFFKKVKTGPLAYNVEYQLQPLRCKPRPLTEAERAAVAAAKPVDEDFPRPTADEIKALLDKITKVESEASGEVPEESADL